MVSQFADNDQVRDELAQYLGGQLTVMFPRKQIVGKIKAIHYGARPGTWSREVFDSTGLMVSWSWLMYYNPSAQGWYQEEAKFNYVINLPLPEFYIDNFGRLAFNSQAIANQGTFYTAHDRYIDM